MGLVRYSFKNWWRSKLTDYVKRWMDFPFNHLSNQFSPVQPYAQSGHNYSHASSVTVLCSTVDWKLGAAYKMACSIGHRYTLKPSSIQTAKKVCGVEEMKGGSGVRAHVNLPNL